VYKVNLMLADSAQVADGKLYVLGAGWSMIVAGGPFAVCGIIDIPWSEATAWHKLRLELIDADGEPVCVPTADDEVGNPIVVEHPPYRATITPHVEPGSSLQWPFAVNVGPGIPLEPGSLHEWRLTIDGMAEEGWSLPFSTVAQQQFPQAA